MIKDVIELKGVGEKKKALLNKINIYTTFDLLRYFPRDYTRLLPPTTIQQAKNNPEHDLVFVKGYFLNKPTLARIPKSVSIIRAKFADITSRIELIWFNQPYRKNIYNTECEYYCYGKLNNKNQLVNPTVVIYDEKEHNKTKHIPIYPLTEGLKQLDFRKLLSQLIPDLRLHIKETIPNDLRIKYSLCENSFAYSEIHFPSNTENLDIARKRFVFEEFLFLQTAILKLRNEKKKNPAIAMKDYNDKLNELLNSLPFKPTGAQTKAINEITHDMQKSTPMNRLLQGDVGSGKTLVAAAAMYMTALNNQQAVLLAPTEILAKQHYITLTELFKKTDIKISILTGSNTAKEKRIIIESLKTGETNLIVGTHALIEKDVEFKNLGLAITDEQHRFGVRQRTLLANHGNGLHVLVMSATPIPRTLALILYGDLDISVLYEKPKFRKPIKTYHVKPSKRSDAYKYIEKLLKDNNQAYVVCPLIEDSESIYANSASKVYDELTQHFPSLRIGLLHGKIKSAEKAALMAAFSAGDIDMLISTTVIEVGIDVKNATVMVIENAERFGLATLHQLRGRIGRGEKESMCFLISDLRTQLIRKRIKTLINSDDGFLIAEKDLELRGPGEHFGLKQHGLPEFNVAKLPEDMNLLIQAKEAAEEILNNKDKYELLINDIEDYFKKKTSSISMN